MIFYLEGGINQRVVGNEYDPTDLGLILPCTRKKRY
jgi:hypothetical protein